MDEPQWIWICRWEDFQHYPPDRDRGPAWIKQHTPQLADERYTDLPPRARALLHDLRMAFATARGQLSDNTRTLSRRVFGQVRRDDLDLLAGAGLIEICSRATLEQRLEAFYTSRAPARSQDLEKEVEEEETKSPSSSSTSLRSDERETPDLAVNGRPALVTPKKTLDDDIPLEPQRTPPAFPCPDCTETFGDWVELQWHKADTHEERQPA